MKFIADFHIHSKYSRATSKDCEIPNLYKFSKIKGINVIGTGDFTHPGWFKELKNYLLPDGNGLFILKDEFKKSIDKNLPAVLNDIPVKFILSTEVSSIYKKNGAVRKIHNVILLPDFESAEKLNKKLSKIGNLEADGRPILGLDSKNLLEIVLEINPKTIFIPAHIWTPWFSLFGANSGFDSINECFEDLTENIFCLETGLSSDPPMNWRLSTLDKFNLVSNSDAHSPQNLAREANLFNTEISYENIYNSLKNKNLNSFLGTIEFFPEEGKYHYDGHRNCSLRLKPKETIENKYICPVCGGVITVGVLHRVELLADRPDGFVPDNAKKYFSLVPLREIIAESLGINKTSPKVEAIYNEMINFLGPELYILKDCPIEEIKKVSTSIIAEGINRVREKRIKINPGFDGQYGEIIIFTEEERTENESQILLLNLNKKFEYKAKKNSYKVSEKFKTEKLEIIKTPDTEQLKAVQELEGPVIVLAGPGTGKTYTLIERIIFLINEKNIEPEKILAITFTNKAADEIKKRIEEKTKSSINIGTFHTIALSILRENNFNQQIIDETDREIILRELIKIKNLKLSLKEASKNILFIKSNLIDPEKLDNPNLKEIFYSYQEKLKDINGIDYEDIIIYVLKLFKNEKILNNYQERFKHILVDEFQDVNLIEYKFVKLLAKDGKNLFVIGDPDQSIYQFRGSNPNLFFKLQNDFKNSKVIKLKTNYRNFDFILKPALNLISKISKNINDENSIKTIFQNKKEKIKIMNTPTDFSGCVQIAKLITSEIGGYSMMQSDILYSEKKRSFSDFAVLVRTNFLIPKIEQTFLKEGIPYKIYGEKSFFEKELPRNLLNIIRLKIEGINNFRISQILNFLKIKSEKNFSNKNDLINFLKEENENLAVAFENFFNIDANEKPIKIIEIFKNIFGENEDFKKFLNIAENYNSIENFLKVILTGKEQDIEFNYERNVEAVSIMTIHSAKGLEFPIVILFSVNDEIIPYKDSNIEEERRLLYVGMTRAIEKLYFIIPDKIEFFGSWHNLPISRFVNEIKKDYFEVEKIEFDKISKVNQMKLF